MTWKCVLSRAEAPVWEPHEAWPGLGQLGHLCLTQVTPKTLPAARSQGLINFMTLARPSWEVGLAPGARAGVEQAMRVPCSTPPCHLGVHGEAPGPEGQEVAVSSPLSLSADQTARTCVLEVSKWWQVKLKATGMV